MLKSLQNIKENLAEPQDNIVIQTGIHQTGRYLNR